MSQPEGSNDPVNSTSPQDGAERAKADSSESLSALTTLYSAERTDVQNSFGHALTMVTLLVGFSAVVGALVTKYQGDELRLVIPLFPIPVWGAVAFHALINALVFTHNQSLAILEGRILDNVRLADDQEESEKLKRWVGATGGRLVTDAPLLFKKSRWPYAAMTVMAYGAIGITVVAFTTACIWVPIVKNVSLVYMVLMAILYGVFFFCAASAWVRTLSINQKTLNDWATESKLVAPRGTVSPL